MRPAEKEWYVGMELGMAWTQVSCYQYPMKEPETKSTIAGGEQYRIPTAICKKGGMGRWYIGEEAKRLAQQQKGGYADGLLERALAKEKILLEESYEAEELLTVFLRKVLHLGVPVQALEQLSRCVVVVERLTGELSEMLERVFLRLGMTQDQLLMIDYRESFYAYAVSQQEELWMQEVQLFDCRADGIWLLNLSHDRRTKPQVCSVAARYLGELSQDPAQRDREFAEMVQEAVGKKLVSAVYLNGDGFEGGWMKESLRLICQGRRAFQGKNLYTKGACYAGVITAHQEEAGTVYFCEYKLFSHIFLKVTDQEREHRYPLAEAGSNLHQLKKECRILLEGEPVLELWSQEPGGRDSVSKRFSLTGLQVQENRRCRLSLCLNGTAEDKLLLRVRDIGFGELQPGTGLEWEYEIGPKGLGETAEERTER